MQKHENIAYFQCIWWLKFVENQEECKILGLQLITEIFIIAVNKVQQNWIIKNKIKKWFKTSKIGKRKKLEKNLLCVRGTARTIK
jgi:hypothetical protein